MVCKPISPSSIPGTVTVQCMLCLSVSTGNDYCSQNAEVVEILTDIFKILCVHMKWAPPSKFQYNFCTDPFPFCKDCRSVVAKLCQFDTLLLDVKKQIVTLASQLSAKILESENDYGSSKSTEGFNPDESSCDQYSKDLLIDSEKSGYYRNSICRRYFPSVRLNSDPTLIVTDNERDIEVSQDELNNWSVPEECQSNILEDDDDGNEEETLVDQRLHTNPFPSLKDRVKRVDGYRFLLDDKCLFECSKTLFKCVSCDLDFSQKYSLKAHLRDCPGNPADDVLQSYKYHSHIYDKILSGELCCRRCKYLCSSQNEMLLHIRFHGNRKKTLKDRIKPFYIELEPNKFVCNQKYSFELKDEKFNCGTCLSDFSTRSEVLSHIQREHIWVNLWKKIVFKNISPDKFSWTDPFNKTYSFERVSSGYKCAHCSYSTLRDRYMKEHVREVHIEGSSICKLCGKVFRSSNYLKIHMDKHADDRQLFICELCGKSYLSLEGLTSHKALQHPEGFDKKFGCEVCGRVFGSLGHLTAHAKVHMDSVCHICGKSILLKYLNRHLSKHLLSHSKENTFKCKKCDKKFRHDSSLFAHLKSHDGAKPFACDICGMKFTQSYSVTRHKNVVHNSSKATKTNTKTQKRKRQEDIPSGEEENEYYDRQSEDENHETCNSEIGGEDT